MFGDDEPATPMASESDDAMTDDGSTPAPRTTIVGGRPPEQDREGPPVPTGIQRLLRLAAVDADFRDRLVAQRDAVAEAAGIALSASERAMLRAIPAAQLAGMAAQLPEPPSARRDFLRKTAATAVVLLGGAALSDCSGDGCGQAGGAGEDPPDRPRHKPMETEGGAAPHEPEPERKREREMIRVGGAAPDEPPERREREAVDAGQADKPKGSPADGGTRPKPKGGYAQPPPGWQGGEAEQAEPEPPRPVRPQSTRGIRVDQPPRRPTGDGERGQD
jgi:hypothetical protein